LRLAAEGFDLALVGRSRTQLSKLSKLIVQTHPGVISYTHVHDVTDHKTIPSLLKNIVAELGGLDLVVYVSGVNRPPGVNTYDFEGDREMVEVNLIGAMAWLDPIAAMFQSARAGQIVAISSVAGDRGRVGNPGYNASKAGLTTYLEALRNRLTRYGVHVLTVKPGFVRTEMLKAAPRVMFPISPNKAAQDIWNAIHSRKQQIYTPALWGLIMLVVRNIPSVIFRRMSF
jgi:short-subunit dehydrogenase